jgi:hypothetical protein
MNPILVKLAAALVGAALIAVPDVASAQFKLDKKAEQAAKKKQKEQRKKAVKKGHEKKAEKNK